MFPACKLICFCICSEVSSGSEEAEIDEDGVFRRKGWTWHLCYSGLTQPFPSPLSRWMVK